jgi:hypothetical protein
MTGWRIDIKSQSAYEEYMATQPPEEEEEEAPVLAAPLA